MGIGGLRVIRRTSDRRTSNLASFHSRHSLTWSWALSVSRSEIMWPKPYLMRNTVGFGAGFGQLLGFHTYTTNGGRQWSVGVLWLTFRWSRQRPVWYRHLYARRRDEQDQRDGMLWLSEIGRAPV